MVTIFYIAQNRELSSNSQNSEATNVTQLTILAISKLHLGSHYKL